MESPPASSSIMLGVSITALGLLVPLGLNGERVPNPFHIQTDCSNNLSRLLMGRIMMLLLGGIGYDSVKRSLQQDNDDTMLNNEYVVHPDTSGRCCRGHDGKCDSSSIDVKFIHLNDSGDITRSVDMCMCTERGESIRSLFNDKKVQDAFKLDLTKDLDKFSDALDLEVRELPGEASQAEKFLEVWIAFQQKYHYCCISPMKGSLLAYASLYTMLNASTDTINRGGIQVNTLSSSDFTCMDSEFTDILKLSNSEIQGIRDRMLSGSNTDQPSLSIRSVVNVTLRPLVPSEGLDPVGIVEQCKRLSRQNESLMPPLTEKIGEVFSHLIKYLSNDRSGQSSVSGELLQNTCWVRTERNGKDKGKGKGITVYDKPSLFSDKKWELFISRLPNLGALDAYRRYMRAKYGCPLPAHITPDILFHDKNIDMFNSTDIRELSLLLYGTVIASIVLQAACENESWKELLERIKFLIRFQVPTKDQLSLKPGKKRKDELYSLYGDEEGFRLYDLTASRNNGMAATLALFKIMEVVLSCDEDDDMSSKVERFFAVANGSTEKTTKQCISVLGEK